jgi:hypothetical protein
MPRQNAETPFQFGGQAVIEGVMMRGPDKMATAVRVGDEIVIHQEKITSWSDSFSILKWPFIRGTIVLIESMVIGIRTLNLSAYLVSEGDEDENLTPLEMGLTVALAILIAVGLFIILPTWLGHMTGGVLNIWLILNSYLLDIIFDLICDMGNNLNSSPIVFSSALLTDHPIIDTTGSNTAALGQILVQKTLIVPQIQVSLCPVFCNKNLPMLIGAHVPRVNVNIRIKLLDDH